MTLVTKSRSIGKAGGYKSTAVFERHVIATGKWDVAASAATTHPIFHGDEITRSEGHSWPQNKGQGDVGGPFFNLKRKVFKSHTYHDGKDEEPLVSGTWDRRRFIFHNAFSCPIETVGSGSSLQPKWPTSLASADAELLAKGATAVARCKPTSGESDLSTALGELYHEGLPSVIGHTTWRNRTLHARNAGEEFLNVEFGWLPLVSDVQSFARSLADSDRIISQYERDRGRLVRRSYSFPTEKTLDVTVLNSDKDPDGQPGLSGSVNSGPTTGGKWIKTTTTSKRRWFSGAFIYGTPLREDHVAASAGLAQKADQLFGLSLTPDVLWNLTPWSWAIDWVTNTGDVLANVSDKMTHGLVMQYGYIMEHTVHTVEYSLTGAVYRGRSVNVPNAKLVTETKKRLGANPFGFGVTWDGLSTAQGAILAALGISRA